MSHAGQRWAWNVKEQPDALSVRRLDFLWQSHFCKLQIQISICRQKKRIRDLFPRQTQTLTKRRGVEIKPNPTSALLSPVICIAGGYKTGWFIFSHVHRWDHRGSSDASLQIFFFFFFWVSFFSRIKKLLITSLFPYYIIINFDTDVPSGKC